MQDYIARKIDINGNIETITIKQFDANSRFLHVTISDMDLPEEYTKIFGMEGCSARLLVTIAHDRYAYVDGEIADAEGGIVTFLLPGSVTQRPGSYLCEIRITEPTNKALISTKPFTLRVEESINADGAIEATPQYSALENALMKVDRNELRVDALAAMADAGEIPAGTVESEVLDARTGWDGTMGYHSADSAFRFGSTSYSCLGDALASQVGKLRDTGLLYLGTLLNSQTWDSATLDGTKTFAGLPNNIFAVCNTVEAANPIADAPVSGPMCGLIVTFGRGDKNTRRNFDTQLFLPQDRLKIRMRKYNGDSWSDWDVVGGAFADSAISSLLSGLAAVPQYRADINDSYAASDRLVSNITDDGTFFANRSVTVNGAEERRWNDLPTDCQNFIVSNAQYSSNWILQTAVPTDSLGTVYNRLIPRPGTNGAPRPWFPVGAPDARMKILALGDSLCAGLRNGGKGFVGDLGLPYINAGVSGAALSTANTGVISIPDRLTRFYNYHAKAVSAQNDGWEPDIIIANGGHNDYSLGAPLGSIPTQPASDINSLDGSKVLDSLQKLFLLMILYYPNAQRFFVINHKIFRNVAGNNADDKNGYLPEKYNNRAYNEDSGQMEPTGQSYTMQQLHDAIVACCNVYNVTVIDVFKDSMLNSFFPAYRSDTYYTYVPDTPDGGWADAVCNTSDYFDADGVHPLSRGYSQGYVPLIREAIRIGTVK